MKYDCSIDVKGFRFFTMERLFFTLYSYSVWEIENSLDNSLNTRGFDLILILIWFNGTSAHMGHFSAKMVVCKMQC